MERLYNQIKRMIAWMREQIGKLPELWALMRAYLQGLIALLRLMSMAMAKRSIPVA